MNKNLKIKGLKCSIITVSVFEEGVSAVPASVGRGQVSENQGLVAASAFLSDSPSVAKVDSVIFDVVQDVLFDICLQSIDNFLLFFNDIVKLINVLSNRFEPALMFMSCLNVEGEDRDSHQEDQKVAE
jgi:hypothetical protein